MPPQPAPPAPKKKSLPVDRALGFSKIAREMLGGACVRCEERYPLQGAHSVIVIVVDRDAPLHREKLSAPFEEFFGREVSDPLAPVKLEVIDRSLGRCDDAPCGSWIDFSGIPRAPRTRRNRG